MGQILHTSTELSYNFFEKKSTNSKVRRAPWPQKGTFSAAVCVGTAFALYQSGSRKEGRAGRNHFRVHWHSGPLLDTQIFHTCASSPAEQPNAARIQKLNRFQQSIFADLVYFPDGIFPAGEIPHVQLADIAVVHNF